MRVDVRPVGTSGMVVLSDTQKRKLGPGRSHVVDIARDEKPRVVDPPPELAASLATVRDGRKRWDALPWYHQRERNLHLQNPLLR